MACRRTNLRRLCLQATDESLGDRVRKALETIDSGDAARRLSQYASLLRLCIQRRALLEGRLVHSHIATAASDGLDTYLGNLLVDLYGRCGSLKDARAAFDAISLKNIFSWNILITRYSQNACYGDVFTMVRIMDLEGIKPEKFTFLGLLDACCRTGYFDRGKNVHARIVQSGWDAEPAVGNSLVSMYGKTGDVESAKLVFDGLVDKTVVSWNAMVAAYARNGHREDGFHLFRLMDLEGYKPDRVTFLSLVEACASSPLPCLQDARLVHARITAAGLDSDVVLGNTLMTMYGRCCSLEDAKKVFDGLSCKTVVNWNAMIAVYNQSDRHKEALDLFWQMLQLEKDGGRVRPDKVTFVSIVDACASSASLLEGREIHLLVENSCFHPDLVVENTLINMYGKCGSPAESRKVFDGMVVKDLVSWNTMLSAFSRNGAGKDTLQLFREMLLEGLSPDKYTFLTLVDACAHLGSPEGIQPGRSIHGSIKTRGYASDVALSTALVNMYGKLGLVDDAKSLFDGMSKKSLVSWNAMIWSYAHSGHYKEAMELYESMDMKPDKVTFAIVVDACAGFGDLSQGKKVHSRIAEYGLKKDRVLENTLINMYGKCCSLDDARAVFDGILQKDIVSWNTMIRACLYNDQPREALRLFHLLEEESTIAPPAAAAVVKPDRVSFVSALDACGCIGEVGLAHGRAVHGSIIGSKVHVDVIVGTALITMYGKSGSVEEARTVFDDMRCKNLVTWSAMMGVYTQNKLGWEALKLCLVMEQEGWRPDRVTFISLLEACGNLENLSWGKRVEDRVKSVGLGDDVVIKTGLINMYGKCGCLDAARLLFDEIGSNKSIMSWNSMMSAYARKGHALEAWKLFEELVQTAGVEPDKVSYTIALDLASSDRNMLGASARKKLLEDVVRNGFESDPLVGTAVLNLYAKFGSLEEARSLFDRLHFRDIVAWTSMMTSYASKGLFHAIVDLFQLMNLEGTRPDEVVFIILLFSCSHAGIFRQGRDYFISMQGDHSLTPFADHYGCMVDLLGRAGWLENAEELLHAMPFKPDEVMWTTLLGACKMHGDVARAARIGKVVEKEVDLSETGTHILLSSMYADSRANVH